MPKGLAFWIIYLVCVILCCFMSWQDWRDNYRPGIVTMVVFILLAILGWAVFGPPIQ